MFGPLQTYRYFLGTYLGPQRRRVALLAALLLSSIGLQLLNPQIIRSFIDTAQAGGAAVALTTAALAFIAAGLAQRAAAFGALYVGENVGWAATNRLRADLARHCLRLDMAFHKSHTPGELIERIDGDVSTLDDFLSQFTVRLLGNGLLIVAILALLFREDWRLGLGLVIYTGVAFAALSGVQQFGTRRWAAYREADAGLFGFLEERISGTEDIRASGAERHTLDRLELLMAGALEKNRSARLASNLTFVATNFLFVIGYALGLAIGAYLYNQGHVSIGTAFLVVYYIGMLAAPLDSIREQAQGLQQASASIGRVSELLALRPRVTEAPRAALPAGALGLAFDGVSFAYDDEGVGSLEMGVGEGDGGGEMGVGVPTPTPNPHLPTPSSQDEGDAGGELGAGRWELGDGDSQLPAPNTYLPTPAHVLADITFTLAPGAIMGLLGRTGSGKTTLTRLIFRLYDPAAGAIRLGGAAIRDVALADLRARVGMVTQDVQLFQASIRDNLALFDRTIDDARIHRALDELGLREWASGLPQGLDTRLGAGGLGLSSGEAQLLAFARVFLRDPGMVILDEASSRLDPATERLLERAIDRLLAGRSAIIIAHRLGTVQRADTILILDQGRVAEHGPRAQLAADDGSRFAQLLRTGLEEVLV